MRRRRLKRRDEKVLRPVHANVGIGAAYRRRLDVLIREMANSVRHWVTQAYAVNTPAIAMDATPAVEMQRAMDEMAARWNLRFHHAAPQLARYFATAAHLRSDKVLMKILKDGGFTVRFKMTPIMQDVLDATIEENVGLIRSIPQKYLGEVQGMVMRSVQAGRELGGLTRELQQQYGVSMRRAALIARDQNNKATAVMTRARQQEIGIDEAIWQHSHGGKEPRRTHLDNSGERYKVTEGWYDPDPKVRRRIWPGELINCRCVSRPVVKGFS